MSKNISFLLGAGFSAPKGYPIGNGLNELLLKSNEDNFAFSSSGSLAVSTDGSKPNFGYKSHFQINYEFCFDLMHNYKELKGNFDYEEFYDYITEEVKSDENVNKVAQPYINDTNSQDSLIGGLKNVYTQVVSFYLKDSEGKKHYDNLPYSIGYHFEGYSGIMKCISDFGETHIINIHTLNHDLFFERFNQTDFLKGDLCDGFEELGSPYYGNIEVKGRNYMARLSHYTGNYDGNFRLYKLHGSLNYSPYFGTNENGILSAETYIKTGYGIGKTKHYKEKVNKDGELEYENSWINYHADFLTGTTSKIQRYKEPLLFKKLFSLFKENLKTSEKLIIIGYGAKDAEVNNIILDYFDYKEKRVYIIDPYAGDTVLTFGKKINAKIIKKKLEDIKDDDFK
jgi:hypothetical protein